MRVYETVLLMLGVLVTGILICGCTKRQYERYASPSQEEVTTTDNPENATTGNSENATADNPDNIEDASEESEPETYAPDNMYAPGELIALCDSREDAENIASLYGIKLRDYSYGVATFFAGKNADIFEIIREGKEKGYPTLSPNYIYTLDDEGGMSIN